MVRQRQFLSTYIFGAVCPDRDKGCAWILPECNSGMMQIHLDEISKNIQENVTAHSRKFLFKAIEMASKEEYPLFLIVLT